MEKRNEQFTRKINKTESPKTPGGISKALLTPCRRLGLSRKWKKGGTSPFVSPLASTDNNKESKINKKDNELRRKRKCSTEEIHDADAKEIEFEHQNVSAILAGNTNCKIDMKTTPTGILSPRKKCRSLLLTKECEEEYENKPRFTTDIDKEVFSTSKPNDLLVESIKPETKVLKLSRKNPKSKSTTLKTTSFTNKTEVSNCDNKVNEESKKNILKHETANVPDCKKEKSPNNLSKECMVVIQKKIFKSNAGKNRINNSVELDKNMKELTSQCLFDSDSDDVPLSCLNNEIVSKHININIEQNSHKLDEVDRKDIAHNDDDFVENKKIEEIKVENKTTSTSGLKTKVDKMNKQVKKMVTLKPQTSSQSSNSLDDDDDDDFDFDKKKTIIIRNTYDKVTKPLKVKSTGSITQKDIDEITARIERKKNLLLAKAMTNETKELRDLIKKWQLGCQNALTELLELMKTKIPEQNMDYSEILHMLKIPPDLVGYDSENDCFITPDDKTIILSGLNIK